jgi:hypothetical protein
VVHLSDFDTWRQVVDWALPLYQPVVVKDSFAGFAPFIIRDQVKTVGSLQRTMPYSVLHPVEFNQTIHIQVPEGSGFDNEFSRVKDSAFYFTKKVSFEKDELLIEYHYKSLSDHVKAKDIKKHARHVQEGSAGSGRILYEWPGI